MAVALVASKAGVVSKGVGLPADERIQQRRVVGNRLPYQVGKLTAAQVERALAFGIFHAHEGVGGGELASQRHGLVQLALNPFTLCFGNGIEPRVQCALHERLGMLFNGLLGAGGRDQVIHH